MALNACFTCGVVLDMGHSWQTAPGAVFLSGVNSLVLSLLPVREWLINVIPRSLELAISAGIGLFLAIIALKNANIVVDHPAALVTMGNVASPEVLLAMAGFVVIVALTARGLVETARRDRLVRRHRMRAGGGHGHRDAGHFTQSRTASVPVSSPARWSSWRRVGRASARCRSM